MMHLPKVGNYYIHYLTSVYMIPLLLFTLLSGNLSADTPNVGLVLSGGGARGFAHIGVLRVLDSLQIPIDYIAGTSMGSIVGGLYAMGYTASQLDSIARNLDWPVLFSDTPRRSRISYLQKWESDRFQLSLKIDNKRIRPPSALIYGQKVSLMLSRLTVPNSEYTTFDDLKIPFRCVAADLISGEEVVLKKGSLIKAIRASVAVPSIFTPLKWGDSLLVDGGVLNNIPIDVVKDMGADIVIAVDVGTPLRSEEELDNAISILMQSFALASRKKEEINLEQADILITPDLTGYSTADFVNSKVAPMIEQGYAAALTKVSELNQLQSDINQKAPLSSKIEEFKGGIIFGINILGNKTISFNLIYQNIGLKPGQNFTIALLEKRIEQLYGLGYFQKIEYSLNEEREGTYRITINVQEKPGSQLGLGFRYQDELKSILGLNLILYDFPFGGFRNDFTVLFSGLQILEWELSYPFRLLNNRIYPYLYGFVQDIPVHIYFNGEKIARYHQRSYGGSGGLGFILKNWADIRADYMYEQLSVTPSIAFSPDLTWPEWTYPTHLGRLYATVDLLDDRLNPKHGYYAQLGFEKSLDFIKQKENMTRFYINQNFYGTPYRRNTTSIHLFLGLSENTDLYRYFYEGGDGSFIGYHYDEFAGPNAGYLRIENQFHWNNYLSFLAIFNTGKVWEEYFDINLDQNLTSGIGIGLQINTIIGPFRYLFSISPDHQIQYFNFGFTLATQNEKRR